MKGIWAMPDDIINKSASVSVENNGFCSCWVNERRTNNRHCCLLLLLLLLLSRFSRVRLCVTPQTAAHQAPLSLGFPRQEYWSGLPFPSPMHESEKWKWSCSVVSDSSRPRGLQPTRLLRPWDISLICGSLSMLCLCCGKMYLKNL